MKYKILKNPIVVLGILCLVLSSCEKEIEFSEETKKPKLVVNSEFTNSDNWSVHISNSLSIIDQADLQNINTATVGIYEGDNLVENLSAGFNGYYTGQTTPQMGHQYTVKVSANNYDPVKGTSILPYNDLEIVGFDTTFFQSQYNESRALQIALQLEDLSDVDNYFGISIRAEYINSITGVQSFENLWINSSDILFSDGLQSSEILLFSDVLFSGQQQTMLLEIQNLGTNFNYITDSEGNTVITYDEPINLYVETKTLSRDMYLYYTTLSQYSNSYGDPFAQPVIVYSNIDEGLGIFGGSASSEFVIEML